MTTAESGDGPDAVRPVDYASILDRNTVEVLAVIDDDDVIVAINSAIEAAFGYPADELVGHRVSEIADLETDPDLRASLLPLEVPGQRGVVTVHVTAADGSLRWVEVTTTDLPDAPGLRLIRARDVTDERSAQAEADLERRRATGIIDTFIDSHMLMLPLLDDSGAVTDLRIERANPAAQAYLQRASADLVGRTVREILGESASVLIGWARAVRAGGQPLVLDDEPLDSAIYGRGRIVDVRAVLIDPEISVSWRDVTERNHERQALAESEARFRLVAENASGAVFSATADAVFDWVSPSVRDLLGWEPDEIVGHRPEELVHPDDLDVMREHMRGVGRGEAQDYRARFRTSDGGHRWIGISARPVLDEEGQLVRRVGSWRDVSAEVEADAALAESERRYRLLAENGSDLVALADNDGVLQWFSDSIRTYGWEPADVVGHPATEFLHPEDQRLLGDVARTTQGGEVARVVWRIAEKDDPDAWHWFRVDLRPLFDDEGHVVGRVSGWQNIDAEVEAQQRLTTESARLQATLDSLMDPHVLVSPIMGADGQAVDVRYEWANERAHAALRAEPGSVVGATARQLLTAEQADWTIDLCRLALDSADGIIADDVPVMRSDGTDLLYLDVRLARVGDVLSLTWRDVTTAHHAMSDLADTAAVSERRLAVFEPELAGIGVRPDEARRILLDFLESSVPRIALQPVVDIGSGGAVVGYEALSRFPDGPLGGPDGWFAAAHRCGLGVRLERASVRESVARLGGLPPDVFLSINVTPQALTEGVLDELDGVDLSRIVVELTEHVPVADYPLVMSILEPRRAAGCRVAVDDAGAGFASLRHVINLRPDVIKLDVAIVRGVDRDPLRQAVARMMIAFSRGIGAEIICEGVETEAEAALLRVLGATWMQGYLYGRPELAGE